VIRFGPGRFGPRSPGGRQEILYATAGSGTLSGLPYLDRSRLRRGMVTPAVVQAFRSMGWGWGGDWSGSTKDYMHFSATGQ